MCARIVDVFHVFFFSSWHNVVTIGAIKEFKVSRLSKVVRICTDIQKTIDTSTHRLVPFILDYSNFVAKVTLTFNTNLRCS